MATRCSATSLAYFNGEKPVTQRQIWHVWHSGASQHEVFTLHPVPRILLSGHQVPPQSERRIMRLLLLSFLLASAAVGASAADNTSLSGKWKIHSSVAGNESDQDCTFTQKDNDLTGSCVSDRGTVEISGKVDGTKVTWTYKSEYQGNPLTVIYRGTLESTTQKIAGTLSVVEYGVEGDFTATQSK